MSTDTAARSAGDMSLIDHLRELRNRLLKSALAVLVGAVVGWIFYETIFDVLTLPYCDVVEAKGATCTLTSFDPLEPFGFRAQVAAYSGIFIALPVIFYQLWRFIAPGLYRKEKAYAATFVAVSTLLFSAGAAVAYLTLPKALEFLLNVGGDGIENLTNVTKYTTLALFTMAAFGVGFEFPIVLIALQFVGLVEPATLSRWRREAIVGITALAALITPSVDPISMFALAIPLYLFYELSILAGKFIVRRREKALRS
ncbi:MAG: twin-arginine translocase subunit TatC [Microthrixaceae bacterium]